MKSNLPAIFSAADQYTVYALYRLTYLGMIWDIWQSRPWRMIWIMILINRYVLLRWWLCNLCQDRHAELNTSIDWCWHLFCLMVHSHLRNTRVFTTWCYKHFCKCLWEYLHSIKANTAAVSMTMLETVITSWHICEKRWLLSKSIDYCITHVVWFGIFLHYWDQIYG